MNHTGDQQVQADPTATPSLVPWITMSWHSVCQRAYRVSGMPACPDPASPSPQLLTPCTWSHAVHFPHPSCCLQLSLTPSCLSIQPQVSQSSFEMTSLIPQAKVFSRTLCRTLHRDPRVPRALLVPLASAGSLQPMAMSLRTSWTSLEVSDILTWCFCSYIRDLSNVS